MSENFDHRTLINVIPDEQTQMLPTETPEETMAQLKQGMEWFENNYPAVGEVRHSTGRGVFELRAIPKHDAEEDHIIRGLRGVFHQVHQGEFADE